jgi:Domain of unknown function (DUF1905)/Bacteriocin-protection, YdeI or OmpD-Associated
VVITIGGHTWRSRVASMGDRFIVGISAASRAASGIAEGDVVEVGLRLDAEPRVVAEPPDLADALDRAPQARAAFDRLPYGLKRKHVRASVRLWVLITTAATRTRQEGGTPARQGGGPRGCSLAA